MNVEEVSIGSGAYTRTAWIARGAAPSACLFLDGEHYLRGVDALSVLDPQGTYLFLSHGDARQVDYVGSADFTRFIGEVVVPWARVNVAPVDVICGLSLSGLAAAHVAVAYPELFSAVLCQSGSFWWESETFAALVRAKPPVGMKFWLSVGDEETAVGVTHLPRGMFQAISQIEGVERAHGVLVEAGAEVHENRFHGGHAYAPWRAELADALRWLR